jgi:hypothetical protein
MRTMTYHCSRCGSTVLANLQILKFEAGNMANELAEDYLDSSGPYLDLCPSCQDSFKSWLKSGRQTGLPTLGAAPAGVVRELDTITR